MSKSNLTQAAVSDLAEQMKSEGKEPTIILIQQQLGGSNTTIKKFIDAWRQASLEKESALAELPEEISRLGQDFIVQLWKTADRSAQKAVATLREINGREKSDGQKQLNEVIEALDLAQGQLKSAELSNQALQQKIQEDACRMAALESQLQGARHLQQELKQTQESLQKKEAECTTLHERLAQAKTINDLVSALQTQTKVGGKT